GCRKEAEQSAHDAAGGPQTTQPSSAAGLGSLLLAPEALFRPTRNGCTLQWIARVPCQTRVLAGPSPDALREFQTVNSLGPAEVNIVGAAPDSDLFIKCEFRAQQGGDWIRQPLRRVRTQRRAGETFKAILIADTHPYAALHKPAGRENTLAAQQRIIAEQPDFVIFLGDEASMIRNIYRGRVVTAEEAAADWLRWRTLYSDLLSQVPSMMVLGNHEGEAGYYQTYTNSNGVMYLQRWATVARKQVLRNPGPTTYPEGGEDEGWVGDPDSPATGGAEQGNRSPLENYFAWTWGDALFVVLDVHRYTNPGGSTPAAPEEWTLGPTQMAWLEKTLRNSTARWKIVVTHHLVGGWRWDGGGHTQETKYYYGRGGAKYARVGEQARITDLMNETGARLLLYGHDHVFAHQQSDNVDFVCCGRVSYLNPEWFDRPGWREAYGDAAARDPYDFYAALGYVRLTISPNSIDLAYVCSGRDGASGENVDSQPGEVVYQRTFSA
ncbi:MAG: hypothetical protein D6744_18550, partial [Planctomycetota bacterium]